MNTELAVQEYQNVMLAPAKVAASGDNYLVSLGNGMALELTRTVDFGVIDNTTKPCLYKSGAERIVMSNGLETRFIIETAIENFAADEPFAFYRVKCECFGRLDGVSIHITDGYGSANTREKQCGRATAYDTANARLKMAEKRALVDVALRIGQLSNMFAQDIENEDFMKTQVEVRGEDDLITASQVKRIYTLASRAGATKEKSKEIVSSFGYASAKEIKQKDYDAVCAMMKGETI